MKFTLLVAAVLLSYCISLIKCFPSDDTPPPDQVTDEYPGDAAYTSLLEKLRKTVSGEQCLPSNQSNPAGCMNFQWRNRTGVTRGQLCNDLVASHFDGPTEGGMSLTNANWLECGDEITKEQLTEACINTLNNPQGFPSHAELPDGSSSLVGWWAWQGFHDGKFYAGGQSFEDDATWDPPVKVGKPPDEKDHQDVHWPGRQTPGSQNGWNESQAGKNFVWGWDPKELKRADYEQVVQHLGKGGVGTHLGFPFEKGRCKFIVWVTPLEAFLEGIRIQGADVPGKPKKKYRKSSTLLLNSDNKSAFGQWEVER